MERSTPVRKPHTSTADLLTWSENQTVSDQATPGGSRPGMRPHQPSTKIGAVLGGQVTDEEVDSLLKRYMSFTVLRGWLRQCEDVPTTPTR
ncbi:hypothetical protein QJS10_CPB19g01434 [Acorus calamus]|uniref:DUF4057 domain-containing protein n=1 Tax=Acorus calamus TaxID=4465 RepID=A0AAV9CFV1_ACOCL|nr:hypothetical protein QJS10_CPB19g01434 [Acorus calamus]